MNLYRATLRTRIAIATGRDPIQFVEYDTQIGMVGETPQAAWSWFFNTWVHSLKGLVFGPGMCTMRVALINVGDWQPNGEFYYCYHPQMARDLRVDFTL